MTPRLIAQYDCETAENPIWHAQEQKLYWLDIPSGRLFSYDPAAKVHDQCFKGDVVGGMTIQRDGALLLFQARGAIRLLKAGQVTTLQSEIPAERESRFNDVISDPAGRVFCGTMSSKEHRGTLYCLSQDRTIKPIVSDVMCSNGLGFSLNLKTLYYTDSGRRVIWMYDYDENSGAMENPREFVKVPEQPGEGVPDGLTVDAEGFIWSARWDGACLVRYDPAGKEERRIPFPCLKVSSLIFGGPDYADIYVTTACVGRDKQDQGPGAGGLFHLNLGIKGRPEFYSSIQV